VKFLIDEDVPIEAVRCLRQTGHEALLVADALGTRIDDVDVWYHAVQTEALVLTCNRQDFLRLAGTEPSTGLIILKRRRTRQAECKRLLALLAAAGETGLMGNINFA
jgi:predicted nuclease of predicted toxin-antitoxin system